MSLLRRFAHHLYGRKARLLCAVLGSTSILLWSTTYAEQTRIQVAAPAQGRVQPLDPLTPEEEKLAVQIANSDPRVKEVLAGGRTQLIRVEFLALKWPGYREANEPEQMKIGRHAFVIYYSYETDQGIHLIIDLEQRSVGEITKMEGKVVPLGAGEVTDAFNLAMRNEQVKGLLGSRAGEFKVAGSSMKDRPETRVEGLRIVATSPKDPCFRHRCISLIFRRREGYIAGTQVTVDLTAQTVRVERTGR